MGAGVSSRYERDGGRQVINRILRAIMPRMPNYGRAADKHPTLEELKCPKCGAIRDEVNVTTNIHDGIVYVAKICDCEFVEK